MTAQCLELRWVGSALGVLEQQDGEEAAEHLAAHEAARCRLIQSCSQHMSRDHLQFNLPVAAQKAAQQTAAQKAAQEAAQQTTARDAEQVAAQKAAVEAARQTAAQHRLPNPPLSRCFSLLSTSTARLALQGKTEERPSFQTLLLSCARGTPSDCELVL